MYQQSPVKAEQSFFFLYKTASVDVVCLLIFICRSPVAAGLVALVAAGVVALDVNRKTASADVTSSVAEPCNFA
jgi:hypothetical protein